MLGIRVYDNYNLIAFQVLDTDEFKGCAFSMKFTPETTDESKILRSKKIKVVTPHEKCRFWFKDDNTKLLPSQFGCVLFKKNVFKAI